ncbi:nuclear transport factor 2 family protein [Flavisphingomonas formosensis]|uniref:nuclear transport factor 2 family protein n=1 Tax=Flavisphingomonas formosensis TaxID=861534 RepID=UPI0012F9D9AC|nr:nuclear transport factor 2 family protein [Sphingomonas formosensis]
MKMPSPKFGFLALLLLFSGFAAAAGGKALTAPRPADDPARIVHELYEAFERGDMTALERLIAPDATWTYYGPAGQLPFGGTRYGPAGVADFFAKVDETLEHPVATQFDYIVSGDRVAVPGTEESTVRATGIRYKADCLHVFRIRNGKIVSFEEFIDSGKVLLAFQGDKSAGIGRSEQAPSSSPAASPALRPIVDRSAGKAIFTTCLGCHGNDGQGRDYMYAPNLTGQNGDYLIRQLTNFREGKRGKIDDGHGFPMVGRATAIPGADGVKAVVTYISTLPKPAAAPVASRAVPAAIAGIVPTCATCHGAAGEGNAEMQAPALNRLDHHYIAQQLINFRTGKRGYHADDDPGALMAASAKDIPDAETITALANYYGRD